MKVHVLVAALGAAFLLPVPALAQDGARHSGSGHYEWRQVPQFGPRATGPGQKRVWVADAQAADCRCDATKIAAADCMQNMQGMMPPAHRAG
jgi:hypothetical protein